jgi:protein-disulfide isomerase
MTRLPLAISALALVVAVVAAGAVFRGEDSDEMPLDRAAVETMIDTRVAAAMAEPQPQPQPQSQPALDAETVGPLVRDYLVNNPEVLDEVVAALDAKREADQQQARTDALSEHGQTIFHSSSSPVGGNPTGDVTLVEFFDYNCGYCKRMLPSMVDLMGSDPNLKVVFKEWPVLTDGSGEAARIALAVQKIAPEKYVDFHVNLMGQPGGGEGINKKRAMQVVADLGLDTAAVEAAAKDPSIDEAIGENFKMAEALGLRGTPSYVVGDTVIPGAVSFEELQKSITEARETPCKTC